MPDMNSHHHNGSRFRVPVIYLRSVQSCRPVYNNQATLDGLNAILAGCTKLNAQGGASCSNQFIRDVEKELLRQLNMAVFIGNNCAQPTLY